MDVIDEIKERAEELEEFYAKGELAIRVAELEVSDRAGSEMIAALRERAAGLEGAIADVIAECPASKPSRAGRGPSEFAYLDTMWDVGEMLRAALAAPADAKGADDAG